MRRPAPPPPRASALAAPARGIRGLALLLGACAPPPLDTGAGDAGPSVRFLFPTSALEGPVCPSFFVAVDIDGHELVDPDAQPEVREGVGHWHLDDDITGDYFAMIDPYLRVQADLGGETSRAYRLTATLVRSDHAALPLAEFPEAEATVEFEVSDDPGCLGGASTELSAR